MKIQILKIDLAKKGLIGKLPKLVLECEDKIFNTRKIRK